MTYWAPAVFGRLATGTGYHGPAMDMKPKRPSRWILALAIVGALFSAFLLLGFFINRHAEKCWIQAQRKARTLLEELPIFDGRRPVLWGESESGNAWEDYWIALEKIRDLEEKELFENKSYRTDAEARTKVVLAIVKHQSALEALTRGAHRGTAAWIYEWEKGGATSVPPWELLATLLAVQRAFAWLQLDAGEAKKGAQALLDAAQLARDAFAGASVTQADFALRWLDGISDDVDAFLASKNAHPEDWGRLARGLRTFDESYPNLPMLLRHEGVCGCFTLLAGPEGAADPQHLQATYRIEAAAAIDLIERVLTQSEGCDELPWTEVAKKQVELAASTAQNSLMDSAYPEFRLKVVEAWRARRARYILLRLGAQYLATGDVPSLADPLGTTIQTKVEGRTLRAWSVGTDGTNDGGDPKKDLVLEVTRP